MLPDFRFVLGALLAIAVLGVAGLGLVASARLARQAYKAPIEEGRSLAYAPGGGGNKFYDGDGVPSFPGSASRNEEVVTRREAPAVPTSTPPEAPQAPPERAPSPAPQSNAAPELVPAPRPVSANEPVAVAPPEDTQVANAPAEPPADGSDDERTETEAAAPQATGDATDVVPPLPRVRPTLRPRRRLAHLHFLGITLDGQQTWPQSTYEKSWRNPGFLGSGAWLTYDKESKTPLSRKPDGKLAAGNRQQ